MRAQDSREHKLFIVCSGGCTTCCDAYYNMMLDVSDQSTVDDICDAEETWWLRKACYRARCMLLHKLATKFDLDAPTMTDIHSYNEDPIVVSTTDIICNDIQRLKSGHIAVFNQCCDPSVTRNGILSKMHPMEGYWLFKGPARSNATLDTFGGTFGSQTFCGAFPTGTFEVIDHQQRLGNSRGSHSQHTHNRNRRDLSTIVTRNNETVVEPWADRRYPTKEYMCFDERYMKNLETMQWNRDNGIVELMPIVVGLGGV